jgi:hypothetical protein
MINEIEILPAVPTGLDEDKTSTPPLNLAAIDAANELTYGGTEACCFVSNGMKQSKSFDLNYGSLSTLTSILSNSVVKEIFEGSLNFN